MSKCENLTVGIDHYAKLTNENAEMYAVLKVCKGYFEEMGLCEDSVTYKMICATLEDEKEGGRKRKKKSPGLVVLEAVISNRVFPKTCGECRFWAAYSCVLKPTLRCKRDKVSRGCPLSCMIGAG